MMTGRSGSAPLGKGRLEFSFREARVCWIDHVHKGTRRPARSTKDDRSNLPLLYRGYPIRFRHSPGFGSFCPQLSRPSSIIARFSMIGGTLVARTF